MKITTEKKELPIVSPKQVEEYIAELATREKSSSQPLKSLAELKEDAFQITHTLIEEIDINGDGFTDKVEANSYRVQNPSGAGEYKWTNIIAVTLGGANHPVVKIDATNELFAPDTNYLLDLSAAVALLDFDGDAADKRVAEAVFSVATFCSNAVSYGNFITYLSKAHNSRANEINEKLQKETYASMSIAESSLERSVGGLTDTSQKNIFLKILEKIKAASQTTDDLAIPLEVASKAYSMWWLENKNWRSQESKDLVEAGLLEKLLHICRFSSAPADDANFLFAMASRIAYQKKSGGFFDGSENGFIATANRIAEKAGYKNYAELQFEIRYGMKPQQYIQAAELLLSKNMLLLEAAIEEMRRLVPEGYQIWDNNIWDMFDLKKRTALKNIGIESVPDLSFDEAMFAVKNYYKDLGFDLDSPPFKGNIVIEPWIRDDKPASDSELPIGDGSKCVITLNYEPSGRLDIESLQTLTHEIGHAIHSILASQNAIGSGLLGFNGTKEEITEGAAMMLQTPVTSKAWMDKYLAGFPTFAREDVREVMAKETKEYSTWWHSVTIVRALWEIGLYDESKPMDERIDAWRELNVKYLGYDDIGLSAATATSYLMLDYHHPVKKPLFYSSYTISQSMREPFVDAIITGLSGDTAALRAQSQKLKKLFEAGARIQSVDEMKRLFEFD